MDVPPIGNVPAHRHQFELPDSTQTLAEGLAEYFAANPMLKRDADLLSAQARQFFRSHDTVHVVYGCGTSMPDEAVVKLASLCGTTGGLGTLLALLAAPYLIARTLWRCLRQRRRWPWEGHDELMHVPLREIRARFGIKVAHESDGS